MKKIIVFTMCLGWVFVGCRGATNSATNTDGVEGFGGTGGQPVVPGSAGSSGAEGVPLGGSGGIVVESTCSMDDEEPCEDGFICVDGRCQRMRPCDDAGCLPNQVCVWVEQLGEIRCVDGECEPGYFWDVENDRCAVVEGTSCEPEEEDSITEACLGFERICAEDDERAWCGTCNDGFLWQSSFCIQKTTCADLRCAGQNRVCLEGDAFSDDACGSCNEGFGEVDGLCERVVVDPMGPAGGTGGSGMMGPDPMNPGPIDPCLVCDEENRICNDAVDGVAECGVCINDLADVEGVCREIGDCEDLDCASENRLCESDPAPYCLEQCVEGFYWNTDAGECQQAQNCEVLACPEGFLCMPSDGRVDARCEQADFCDEAEGLGMWIREDFPSECIPCDVVPACNDAEGETGHFIVKSRANGVTCMCETRDGFFLNTENEATECDADGDGWTNDNAFASISSGNFAVRENTRCLLRQVETIELRNDHGQSKSIGLVSAEAGLLPLYESPRNDQLLDQAQVSYGNAEARIDKRALNSFTKGCKGVSEDFNHNEVADIREGRGSQLPPADQSRNGNESLRSIYARYLDWSYFMELHDGWFEAAPVVEPEPVGGMDQQEAEVGDDSNQRVVRGKYVIRERARSGAQPAMPLQSVQTTAQNNYWRSCGRHSDSLYSADAVSFVGGDLTQAEAREVNGGIRNGSAWWGMGHHSQFKCMHVLGDDDYASFGDPPVQGSLQNTPERVRKNASGELKFIRDVLNEDGAFVRSEVNKWYANECSLQADGGEFAPGAQSVMFPAFSCALRRTDDEVSTGRVYWAVVGYENEGVQNDNNAVVPEYERGCINECHELGVSACPNFDPEDGAASVRLTCDVEAVNNYGQIQCGCHLNFAGPDCNYYCGGNDRFRSEDYSVFTRAGSWMCGEFRPTGETEFTGNGMTLRGHVSMGIPEHQPHQAFTSGNMRLQTVDYRIKDFREPEED